jgi:hypothetical protein
MSPSSNTLVVSSGPLAEISVLDGSMNTVARSVGELREDLAPGLYKIRVRNGPSPEVEERFVSLNQNRTMSIDAPPIFSPIPLEGTTRSREYHMSRAADSSRNPQFSFGQGSGLFVFAREWSASGTGAHNNPAAGLEITDEPGKLLAEIGKTATIELSNDPSAAWCATVSPGAYRLRFALADGSIIERALFASPGCQTQIFILLSSASGPAAKAHPNLAGGAVIMSSKFQFDPQNRGTQLGEIARYALTQKRRVLNDQLRCEIVDEKFDDPMLGLLGAHLILRDEPDNVALFETLTGNLLRLLGPDHPDLRVLCLRRRTPLLGTRRSLESPPMLRASWDLAVEASLESPNSFPEAGSVADIADKIVPTASWLVWRREPALEHPGASEIGSALALSIQDFVAARARLDASRLANARGVIGYVSSAIYNYLSAGWHTIRGTPRPTSPKPSLSDDDKAELARVLAIPGPKLESLLKKIFD